MIQKKTSLVKVLIVCLTLSFLVGCSASASIDATARQPLMQRPAHSPGVITLAASDKLGAMIVGRHPVILAQRENKIRLAANQPAAGRF